MTSPTTIMITNNIGQRLELAVVLGEKSYNRYVFQSVPARFSESMPASWLVKQSSLRRWKRSCP